MAYDATLKKQRTFVEQIIIISALAIFMAVLINYLMSGQDEVKRTSFNNVKAQFISQIAIVRGQWLLEGKPQWLEMNEFKGGEVLDTDVYRVYVNSSGWPDSPDEQNREAEAAINCEFIWQNVLSTALEVADEPVTDILISTAGNGSEQQWRCRYLLDETLYFDYNPRTGKVN